MTDAAKTVTPRAPLVKLADVIRTIREEQTSDAIFGGQTTEAKREAARIYASRILEQANEIDRLLDEIAAVEKPE